MKKSTLAIAALISTLSTAIIMPAAYADDSTPAATTAPDSSATPDTSTTAPDSSATPDTSSDSDS